MSSFNYYQEMAKVKNIVRTKFLPLVIQGTEIDVDELTYTLDKQGIIYSERAIIQYIKKINKIENLQYEEKTKKWYK